LAAAGTLHFADGDTSKTFTVPIKAVALTKPDTTVRLNLFNVTGGATLGRTNATLIIVNDHYAPGHLSFGGGVLVSNVMNFSTNENAGTALITINRLGGSSGTLSVTAIISDGTAFNHTNYLSSTNVLLSWNSGDATP